MADVSEEEAKAYFVEHCGTAARVIAEHCAMAGGVDEHGELWGLCEACHKPTPADALVADHLEPLELEKIDSGDPNYPVWYAMSRPRVRCLVCAAAGREADREPEQ